MIQKYGRKISVKQIFQFFVHIKLPEKTLKFDGTGVNKKIFMLLSSKSVYVQWALIK